MSTKTPKPEGAKPAKKVIEWDLIEVDYRAGIKSLRQMAEEYGVSHVAIKKKADVKGWIRDLQAAIQAKADAMVNRAVVTAEVNAAKAVTEAAVVEANADVQFRIRMEHRQDIGRTRALFRSLINELEVASSDEGDDLIRTLFEIVHGNPDEEAEESSKAAAARAQKMREMLHKLLGGPSRVDSAKKLTEMLEKLIRMEREAFGIDNTKGEGGYEDLLRRIAEKE
jgi:hypothetical protein